jgi:hypothetical protein
MGIYVCLIPTPVGPLLMRISSQMVDFNIRISFEYCNQFKRRHITVIILG